MPPRASVLLSTYNQPRLLDLCLCGYEQQSTDDFEILIADDGSGPETREVIEARTRTSNVPLIHVWQPDEGFRKARAVNLAVLASRGEHLVFSDGDCIPSRSFVAGHLGAAAPGTYAVGGHTRLSLAVTEALTEELVRSGGLERTVSPAERAELWWTHLKSLAYIAAHKRRKPKFFGLNFSADRGAFFRVNGFDANYKDHGREDSDLRNRMQLAGIRARSLWHRSLVFHQHHPAHPTRRGTGREAAAYYNRPDLAPEAPYGLRELEGELGRAERGPSPLAP